jgi:hypothetical protein
MASMIPVQGLFSKFSNYAGTKIKNFFNRGSFQNKRKLQGLKHYLSLIVNDIFIILFLK